MIYLTGDTHGDFADVVRFCLKQNTTREDILVIMGDAGINFTAGERDVRVKAALEEVPITLFCVHGNHEIRPFTIDTYHEADWHGGRVYVEDAYPSLIFAKDGEIYDLDGKKTIVLGGAYSVDKFYRLKMGYPWFADEQPSDEIKAYAEAQLEKAGWEVDTVFSHTTPMKYVPRDMFLQTIDQSLVDDSTEEWLDTIEDRLTYRRWYAGHFHCERTIDNFRILFHDFIEMG